MKALFPALTRASNRILDLIYPPRCVFCGGFLPLEEPQAGICPDCASALPRTGPDSAGQPGDCFSLCFSPLFYQDKVKASVRRYKFSGREYYHKVYGVLLRDCLRQYLPEPPELVTWAPLSCWRYYRRGYDQARLLAQEAALLYRLKAVRLLRKVRHTKAQSSLSREARWENVKGAYGLARDVQVAGKRILLVDDVITTGATLSACGAVLLAAGAKEVVCATLARSQIHSDLSNFPEEFF